LGATLKTALLIFCVTLVEVKVREQRPDIGHRHRPNANPEFMGQDLRTDSHGFRSLPIPDKLGTVVAGIAFVDDSIGWGVAEKETFANQVITAPQGSGCKVDGYNMGGGNYNMTQVLAPFRDVGAGK
jgi:hypothetical protein